LFETLYSNCVAITSKSKALIRDYIENNDNEPKAKKSQKINSNSYKLIKLKN
jgi:hypothetical protein